MRKISPSIPTEPSAGGWLRCLSVAILLAGAFAVLAEDEPRPLSLELLSEYNIPGGTRFADTCVGGLSALAYDPPTDRYFAVSDSRRDARMYTLRIEITEGDVAGESAPPRIARVEFESVVRFLTREGLPYPDDRVDPEGLAILDPRSAFLSSEGVADLGVAPFVDLIELATGEWLSTLPIPLAFRPQHRDEIQTVGVRSNLGFEALTLSPDRRQLYVASESALAQDASGLAVGVLHFARLLHFELEPSPRRVGEYLYPLIVPEGDVKVQGLVELLALDNTGRFLAMERVWGPTVGMDVDLYEIRLGRRRAEADRSRLSPVARALPVLDKRPVLDFNQLPIVLDNLEGLTFGPPLASGGETLLVIGDNDNTQCQPPRQPSQLRPTKFLLFQLRR